VDTHFIRIVYLCGQVNINHVLYVVVMVEEDKEADEEDIEDDEEEEDIILGYNSPRVLS